MPEKREILFSRPMMPPIEEYYEEIKEIWGSKWLATFGPKQRLFEEKLKGYLETDNDVLAFSNGHTALEAIVGSLGDTGEIITTPFTFISTANAIVRNGFTPVFCDIKDDMTIDAEQVEKMINPNTVAVLATHVMGNVCDVDALDVIRKKYNIKIIYDGAHVFGVRHCGKNICEFGDAIMFSFHASKVFNSAEGGLAVINVEKIKHRVEQYRYYGMDSGEAVIPGTNGKMHELTAAFGICNLRHINEYIEKRKSAYELYRESLEGVAGIYMRIDNPMTEYNYIYCYIHVDKDLYGIDALTLVAILNRNGVHAKKCFPKLICDMELYKDSNKGDIKKAYYYLDNIVVLPLHSELSKEDIKYVCDIIKNAKAR